MAKRFDMANQAYEYYHNKIITEGVPFGDTKALFNVGFYLDNPILKEITNTERNWSYDYAEAEWEWARYMVKCQRYGNAWLIVAAKLTQTTVINGSAISSLIT